MANLDNQSQKFIYIRSLKEKIPCSEQQFKEFYREATRIRKKEQYYHVASALSNLSGPAMAIAKIASII